MTDKIIEQNGTIGFINLEGLFIPLTAEVVSVSSQGSKTTYAGFNPETQKLTISEDPRSLLGLDRYRGQLDHPDYCFACHASGGHCGCSGGFWQHQCWSFDEKGWQPRS